MLAYIDFGCRFDLIDIKFKNGGQVMAIYVKLEDFDENTVLAERDQFKIAGLHFQVQSRSFFELNGKGKKFPGRLGLKDFTELFKKNELEHYLFYVPMGDLDKLTNFLKQTYEIYKEYQKIPRWKRFIDSIKMKF